MPRLLPPGEKTPQKSPKTADFLVPDSGAKRRTRLFSGSSDMFASTTPRKKSTEGDEDDISPMKKVSFNPRPLPATPGRKGFVAPSILKTPSKVKQKVVFVPF